MLVVYSVVRYILIPYVIITQKEQLLSAIQNNTATMQSNTAMVYMVLQMVACQSWQQCQSGSYVSVVRHPSPTLYPSRTLHFSPTLDLPFMRPSRTFHQPVTRASPTLYAPFTHTHPSRTLHLTQYSAQSPTFALDIAASDHGRVRHTKFALDIAAVDWWFDDRRRAFHARIVKC